MTIRCRGAAINGSGTTVALAWPPLDSSLGGQVIIMMGTKKRDFTPIPRVSLDDFVPKGHFYRRLEETLDLSFVRELVRPLYALRGRPSVDPAVCSSNSSSSCPLRASAPSGGSWRSRRTV
jgi:hypothetical protein